MPAFKFMRFLGFKKLKQTHTNTRPTIIQYFIYFIFYENIEFSLNIMIFMNFLFIYKIGQFNI